MFVFRFAFFIFSISTDTDAGGEDKLLLRETLPVPRVLETLVQVANCYVKKKEKNDHFKMIKKFSHHFINNKGTETCYFLSLVWVNIDSNVAYGLDYLEKHGLAQKSERAQ